MGVKINLRIITKNNAADSEKGFLIKSISKPYGRATAMQQACELNSYNSFFPREGSLCRLISRNFQIC